LEKLWGPGRYWTGLGNDFIRFPSYTQIIIFSDQTLSEKKNLKGAAFDENAFFYPSITARTA
jgi:hypothetical protein